MSKVEIRQSAADDLDNLTSYIIRNSGMWRTALAYAIRIEQQCYKLGDVPRMGRARDDIKPGLRTLPFENVVIVYLLENEKVLITNIFHASQDYEALLRDS